MIAASDRIVLRLSRSEWMQRSLALHRVAVQSIEAERHVIILGYGRNGQRLARLLDAEGVRYVALDLDPGARARGRRRRRHGGVRRQRCGARRWSRRASCAPRRWCSPSPTPRPRCACSRTSTTLNPSLPVIVRARDEADIARAHRGRRLRGGARGVRVGRDARLAHAGLGRRAAQPRHAARAPGARRALRPAARPVPRPRATRTARATPARGCTR